VYKHNDKESFPIRLTSKNNKKISITGQEQCKSVLEDLKNGEYVVKKVKKTEKNKNPLPPFTTSTFQQEAYKKLNFTTKRTMSIAQQLYEGVDIKNYGTVGLISYMRTDSVRISKEAQLSAKEFISNKFGEQYIPDSPREFKGKKNIQDAHEAIRPTNIELSPELIKDSLKPEQYKIYNLIWKRFMASQMASCIMDTISISIYNGNYKFLANGSTVKFEGFMKLYEYSTDDEKNNIELPDLEEEEILKCKDVLEKQHFTQPPARFSEASLIKTLEENGIGRPSTYAPIVSTLLGRGYVEREKKTLLPTELGLIVNDIVSQYFKQIVDVDFTASMEDKLDSIEEGNKEWKKVVDAFYAPLRNLIDIAEKEIAKITIEDKVSDIPCDKCGKLMVIKKGRFGDFLACPGYPECKNTKQIQTELEIPCPKCGGVIVQRRSKKGRTFYGCNNYPQCDFVSWDEPTDKKCPICETLMVVKTNKKLGEFYQCPNKECKHIEEKAKDETKDENNE
jgi:DNA topoisomerase-1